MGKIIRLVWTDVLKNRMVIAYMILLLTLSLSAFMLEDNSAKGLLTLLNIILFTVPLVSIIFTTIYLYNSNEFIELLVSQPISREKIWMGLFAGLSATLSVVYFIGVGMPMLLYADVSIALLMMSTGWLTSLAFVSLAFLCAVLLRDKAKGIGLAIMLWLFFALLFDGLLLFLVFQLSDYPIEKIMLALTALSPIDLARVTMLLRLDESAIMGYTGAVFNKILGNHWGIAAALGLLCLWVIIPLSVSLKKFKVKDL